jgi:membrane protein DedA with SNARE-associated domain
MADTILGYLLEHGLFFIVLALIVAGLGMPVPEDIMLLAAGVLVSQGKTSYLEALAACAVGVMVGDTMIFSFARRLGPAALSRRPFNLLITPERHAKIEGMFHKYGNVIVFMARHMAGLRAPTFAMAGMHNMPLSQFWLWDGLGICVSAPVVIYIGKLFGDNLDEAKRLLHSYAPFIFAGVLTVGLTVIWFKRRRERRAAEQAGTPAP